MLHAKPAIYGPDFFFLMDWRERYPYWNSPGILARREIGDCYAMVAEAILNTQQPYPGDELFENLTLLPELRFKVERQPNTENYT